MEENKTQKGFLWRTLEGFGVQGMQAFIQLVLARILLPEDFGVIAILSVFINLANTLVQNGLSSALLQKKDPQQKDYSTVFYVELAISAGMYLAAFLLAPVIADFYGNPALTAYLRVFALTTVLSALGSIQTTVLRSRMDFKSGFFANFAGIVVQGILGVYLALKGFGVWSLIVSQIAFRAVSCILLFLFARFIPKAGFSRSSFRELFAFSWKLLLGWIISTLYIDIFSLIIGKVFDEKTLGYYSKGSTIPNLINKVVIQVTAAVMFPVIAGIRDEREKIRTETRTLMSVSAALVLPVLAGIAAAAEPMIMALFTEKWAPAVPIIQIMCIPFAFGALSSANMQTFNAMGRSDVFLKCEAVKRTVTVAAVIAVSRISLQAILYTIAGMEVLSLLPNAYYNKKLLGYRLREQLADILPYLVYALLLFAVVYPINLLKIGYMAKLLVQIAACGVIYVGTILLARRGAFADMKKAALDIIGKKKAGV